MGLHSEQDPVLLFLMLIMFNSVSGDWLNMFDYLKCWGNKSTLKLAKAGTRVRVICWEPRKKGNPLTIKPCLMWSNMVFQRPL
uniref:Uncharacterized protein n=1 Tax=Moschus moschiferus TaxID=68415 RepID=A0A8C6DT62_MOSMO